MFYTIDDILNPTKDGMVANKGIIISAYTARYNALQKKILWACCTFETSYFVHVRIPSENKLCPHLWYDIVFELYPTRKEDISAGTLRNYGVRVFSNYPTFMFSFTYAYNKYDLLIPWLKSKCSHRALFQLPVHTNPRAIIGTDIKLWFAAFHIKNIGLFDKRKFTVAINTSAPHIGRVVIPQEAMLKMRQDAQNAGVENSKREAKRKAKNISRHKDYEAHKDIEREVINHAHSTGQHVGSAHEIAKTMVKHAKAPRTARMLKSSRTARKPKKSR